MPGLTDHIEIDINKIRSLATDNIQDIANVICEHIQFARQHGSDRLYWFDKVWKDGGEQVVEEFYYRFLKFIGRENTRTVRKSNELVALIKKPPTPELLDRPILNKIAMLNGVYDLYDDRFLPEDSSYLCPIHIPIVYDPISQCPYWMSFLESLLPVKGGAEYLLDFISICIVPYTKLQTYLILHGPGSNGKGTFLRALRMVVGVKNTCSTSLHRLNSDNEFVTYELVGKLLCASGDLKGSHLPDMSVLKQIVGEDPIMVCHKGKPGYEYEPFVRFIFGTNFDLSTDDNSVGFKRRTIIVPFTRKFTVGEEDVIENLSNPTELSGLFNLLIKRLPVIVNNGKITPSPEVASLIDNWVEVADETIVWLKARLETGNGEDFVSMGLLYSHFVKSCPTPNVNGCSELLMVNCLKHVFSGITLEDGKIYGIRLKVRMEEI